MRKLIYLMGLVLVFFTCATDPVEPENRGGFRPMIWEIRDQNSHGYLMGTMHLGKPDYLPFSETLLGILDEAEVLVLEISPDDLAAVDLANSLERLSPLPEDFGLEDHLTSEEIAVLFDYFPQVNEQRMLSRHPLEIQMELTIQMGMLEGLSPFYGTEALLMAASLQRGLELGGLESPDDQLLAMSGSLEEQIQELQDMLGEPESQQESLIDTIRIFEEGDLSSLKEMAQSLKQEEPLFYERMIIQRNATQTQGIIDFLQEDRVFLAAVGMLHLGGEDSLISLLEEKGITTELLTNP